MAGSFVFLVHGMGVHEKGWSAKWQACLAENARRFEPYASGASDFAADVEFVEIVYDTIFEAGYRQRWKSLADSLADQALPAGVKAVLAEFQGNPDPRVPEFVFTHVLDVLLWYGVQTARRAVIARVARQLTDGVERAHSAGAKIHLLAHSLGTSVVHDTLLCLASGKETWKAFDPARGGIRWTSLVTVANVSRLLTARDTPSDDLPVEAFRPAQSRVRPGDLVGDFINVRHSLDPFTWPRTFEPKPAWPAPTYRLTTPDRFDSPKEVHDLPTQFDHPLTARSALRFFTGKTGLGSSTEFDSARAAYATKYPRSLEELFSRMQQQISADPERPFDLDELARYFGTFGGGES